MQPYLWAWLLIAPAVFAALSFNTSGKTSYGRSTTRPLSDYD